MNVSWFFFSVHPLRVLLTLCFGSCVTQKKCDSCSSCPPCVVTFAALTHATTQFLNWFYSCTFSITLYPSTKLSFKLYTAFYKQAAILAVTFCGLPLLWEC